MTSLVELKAAGHWASALLPASLRVASGSSGTIVTRTDAVDWFALPSGTAGRLDGVTWLHHQTRTHFVIVGMRGAC
jgi:hypothetical protein